MRVLGFVTLAVLVSSAAAPAVAQNVRQNRWVERNSIYKTAGCRFKTARAIRYFGNAGCSNDRPSVAPPGPRHACARFRASTEPRSLDSTPEPRLEAVGIGQAVRCLQLRSNARNLSSSISTTSAGGARSAAAWMAARLRNGD